MKATIKATGEIVEIKDLYDDGTALVGNTTIEVKSPYKEEPKIF